MIMPTPAILVLDTETTGLDPGSCAVVEFGACAVVADNGGWTPTEAFSRLVHPGQPIPPESSAIHHIVDADVADALPLPRVVDTFMVWLASRGIAPALFVAHHAASDKAFLGGLTQRFPEVPWLCTERLAHHLWPELPSYSNQALRYRFSIEPRFALATSCGGRTDPHSAAGDAIVTAGLLCHELAVARIALPDMRGLRHLAQHAELPYRLATIPFGKHKGMAFADLPADYADWLARTSTDPDILHSLAHRHDTASRKIYATAAS